MGAIHTLWCQGINERFSWVEAVQKEFLTNQHWIESDIDHFSSFSYKKLQWKYLPLEDEVPDGLSWESFSISICFLRFISVSRINCLKDGSSSKYNSISFSKRFASKTQARAGSSAGSNLAIKLKMI